MRDTNDMFHHQFYFGTASDVCSSDPCMNGATCLVVFGSVVCVCADGWDGPTCEGEYWIKGYIWLVMNKTFVVLLDWDSQYLYMAAILENGGPNRGTESKTGKESERLVMEFHNNWACAFVSNLPNNDSDWSITKYSVKHDRHALPCTAPHHATHCTALREWFRSCLFMCTLLELFVYQSSYLSTPAGAVWKPEDCYGISLLIYYLS